MEIFKSTRNKSNKLWLIGKPIPSFNVNGGDRPSQIKVLARLYFCLQVNKQNINESALVVAREILTAWKISYFSHQTMANVAKKIKMLREKYRAILKNRCRKTSTEITKRNSFIDQFNKIFNIGKFMNIKSTSSSQLVDKQIARPLTAIENLQSTSSAVLIYRESATESSSISDNVISDFELGLLASEKKGVESSKSCKKPNPIVTSQVAVACDRAQLSSRRAALIISATANALGHNLSDISVSAETVRRTRKSARQEVSEYIKASFSSGAILNIHWDGKLLPDLTSKDSTLDVVDRLAIIAAGNGETKLLEIPKLPNGTGAMVANAVFNALQKWNITNQVKGMVFDTTASNTGKFKGACHLLEVKLQRRLLWFACRHHVHEIMLSKVFAVIMKEECRGPEIEIFKILRNNWTKLNKTEIKSGMLENKVKHAISENMKIKIIEFIKFQLAKMESGRDDHKECLHLSLMFLGEPQEVTIRQPGAISRARWMAKIIYCLKMYLFRHQLELNENLLDKLCEFNIFVLKIYLQKWFTCTKACWAANNDLELLQDLNQYKNTNIEVAEEAIRSFKHHLWYLSEPLVGLAFFDRRISTETKYAMLKNFQESTIDKQNFIKASIEDQNINDLRLEDFVSKNTKLIFKLYFNMENPNFFQKNPKFWIDDPEYIKLEEITNQMLVVNDTAERGIALIKNYNAILTKDENEKQLLLQVVEDHYKHFPTLSKRNIIDNYQP